LCSFQRFAIFKIPILGDTKPAIVLIQRLQRTVCHKTLKRKKFFVIKVVPIQVYKEGVKKFLQISETIVCIIYNMGALRISTFEAIKKTSSQKTKHLY
jgi:hypothetical protein